jgi:hypothetical protein
MKPLSGVFFPRFGLFALSFLGFSISHALFSQVEDNFNPRSQVWNAALGDSTWIPGQIIVKWNPEAWQRLQSDSLFQKQILPVGSTIEWLFPGFIPEKRTQIPGQLPTDLSKITAVYFSDSLSVWDWSYRLNKSGLVAYAEPRFKVYPMLVPNDPGFGFQWQIPHIGADSVWSVSTGDTNTVVAVVDGGTNFSHPDLLGNIAYNYADPIDGIDNDNDGYIDNFRGWDVGDADNNPNYTPNDSYNSNHGVLMSGYIAATPNNNTGIAGIGFNAKYLPVKMVKSNEGWTRGYEGIVYAARKGAHFINCSWGGTTPTLFAQDALRYAVVDKGCVVFAAAGNSNNQTILYPSGYEHTLSVGASTVSNIKSSGSSYYRQVNLHAPGVNTYTTTGNSYGYGTGTSDASAITAGAAGLLHGVLQSYTPGQIADVLLNHTYQTDTISGNAAFAGKMGEGRVDLIQAAFQPKRARLHFVKRNWTDSDGDRIFLIGDTVWLGGESYNRLLGAHTNLTVRIEAFSPYVQWLDSIALPGAVPAGGVAVHPWNEFGFVVAPNCPSNHRVHFRAYYQDTNRVGQTDFYLFLNPGQYDWQENEVNISISATGRLGFSDNATYQGIGWRRGEGPNQLLETFFNPMGFWIGNSNQVLNQTLSSPFTGCCPLATQNQFSASQPIYTEKVESFGLRRVVSNFTDNLQNRWAVERRVWGDTVGWKKGVLLLEHEVKNTSNQQQGPIYMGYFADQDMPDSNFLRAGNEAGYYANGRMGWQRNIRSGVVQGMVLLQPGPVHYYALESTGVGGSIQTTNGFTDAEKWTLVQGGIARSYSPPGDASQYLGGVLDSIGPNRCGIFHMALITAGSLSVAQALSDSLIQAYQTKINVWTGGGFNDNWHNPLNWSQMRFPDQNDRVYIVPSLYVAGTDPVVHSGDAKAGFIETKCGGKLTVQGPWLLEVGP